MQIWLVGAVINGSLVRSMEGEGGEWGDLLSNRETNKNNMVTISHNRLPTSWQFNNRGERESLMIIVISNFQLSYPSSYILRYICT